MSHALPRLGRRAFLRYAVDTCACAAGLRAHTAFTHLRADVAHRTVSPALRLAIVVVRSNDELATSAMGVTLGCDEAARAGSLLGGSIDVAGRADSVASTLALVRRDRLSAVLCAADADAVAEIGRECVSLETPLFNLTATDDSLRNARCSRLTFHVCASDAMRQSALRMLPDAPARGNTTIELWDDRLERFGAAQLNDRFRSRFNRPMGSSAWAGWFAVKVAWEASLRARSSDGSAIAAYLERDTTQFDGQKGVPLSFRRWDHQLRQPLYAASPSRTSEPVSIPALNAESARNQLDALGANEEATACHWP
jgi:hypothetical protein